jgi:hypothetical protein
MGLDAWGYTVKAELIGERLIDIAIPEPQAREIAYWRKHHALHEWMEGLYRAKGGAAKEFNCTAVRLDAADLDLLERSVSEAWGKQGDDPREGYNPVHQRADIEFLAAARGAIADGMAVLYHAWW